MVPDYISEKVMKELKKNENGDGDCYPCMGCRSFLTPDRSVSLGNIAKAKNYVDGKNEIIITCSNTAITEENLQLFYDNCDGVKIGTSVQNNLELYKSLFYTMDYIDSNKYGVIDCFYN